MDSFNVMKGVPVPERVRRGGRVAKARPAAGQVRVVMGFKVTSSVPVPTGRTMRPRSYEDLFRALKVGDSFPFPKGKSISMRSAASRYSKSLGRTFTYRMSRAGSGRVWRTK